VSKAFGTGIGPELSFQDIEVRRRANGEPQLILHGRGESFARENGICEVKISLTHAKGYAAANAVVIAE
jgi:holo-[acyl-carrier protein] synthase